jgi:hypothetical protein
VSRLYTGPAGSRQRPSTVVILTGLVLALPGCGSFSGMGDDLTTGSIGPVVTPTPPARTDRSPGPSDWETVKKQVARAPVAGGSIPWQNDTTGNSGTISDVIASTARGKPCRGFSATVTSVDGVRAYRGEVCREGRVWEYVIVQPVDRASDRL